MTDQELERWARGLGAAEAARVRPDAVAEQVVARLRGARRGRWGRLAGWGLAAAAAASLLVVAERTAWRAPAAPEPAVLAGGTLGTLDAEGLGEALDSLATLTPAPAVVVGGLGTLTAAELERLLAAMES